DVVAAFATPAISRLGRGRVSSGGVTTWALFPDCSVGGRWARERRSRARSAPHLPPGRVVPAPVRQATASCLVPPGLPPGGCGDDAVILPGWAQIRTAPGPDPAAMREVFGPSPAPRNRRRENGHSMWFPEVGRRARSPPGTPHVAEAAPVVGRVGAPHGRAVPQVRAPG